jgi:transcription elongation factor Elf1
MIHNFYNTPTITFACNRCGVKRVVQARLPSIARRSMRIIRWMTKVVDGEIADYCPTCGESVRAECRAIAAAKQRERSRSRHSPP